MVDPLNIMVSVSRKINQMIAEIRVKKAELEGMMSSIATYFNPLEAATVNIPPSIMIGVLSKTLIFV